MYQGTKSVLTFDPKDKYVKNQNYAVGLSDTDTAFYQSAADQLYAKYIGSNAGVGEQDKTNYKALLATTVKYLEYARLHSFAEANNNAEIAAQIKAIVDNQVARTGQYQNAINILKNGSFESDKTNWLETMDPSDIGNTRIATGNNCKSDKCMALTKLKNIPGKWPMFYQLIGDLEVGKTYELAASFKTEGNKATGTINLTRLNPDGTWASTLFTLGGDTTWRKISGEITIPAGMGDGWRAYFYSDSIDTIYYDDISLTKID
jgi:hypothetical protein